MKKLILLILFLFSANNLYAHPGHQHSFIHFEILYVVTALIAVMIFKDFYLKKNKKEKNYSTIEIKKQN
tara:strand:- start:106 stop:312 length:207 start_codon:yes stop_codon:yes gene_type:complete